MVFLFRDKEDACLFAFLLLIILPRISFPEVSITYIYIYMLLCPQNPPGKNIGVGSHSLLPDSGIEPRSPKLQADSLPSEPPGNCLEKSQDLVASCSISGTTPGLDVLANSLSNRFLGNQNNYFQYYLVPGKCKCQEDKYCSSLWFFFLPKFWC